MTRWFQISTNAIGGMGEAKGLPRWVCGALLLTAGLLAVGCDSASLAPPRPAELGGAGVGTAPVPGTSSLPVRTPSSPAASIKPIELIAGPREPEESEMLKGGARIQAGLDKVRI